MEITMSLLYLQEKCGKRLKFVNVQLCVFTMEATSNVELNNYEEHAVPFIITFKLELLEFYIMSVITSMFLT